MTTTTCFAITASLLSRPLRQCLLLLLRGFPMTCIALLLTGAAIVEAAPPSPLAGTWKEIGGAGAARIAPCTTRADLLCATRLDAATSVGGAAEGPLVLSEIAIAGANKWRGRYHDGRQRYPATLRLLGPTTVEMKVCVLFVCQSARYGRAG